MIFSFKCNCPDGREEADFPVGKAPPNIGQCRDCGAFIDRDFEADLPSIAAMDPYRQYHLSSRKMRAEAEQGRPIGGPQDNLERKRLEKENGIRYVGDDTSGFSKKAQRGIEYQRERKRAGEVV